MKKGDKFSAYETGQGSYLRDSGEKTKTFKNRPHSGNPLTFVKMKKWNGRQPIIEAIATQGLELNLDLFAWRVVSLNRKTTKHRKAPKTP